MYRNHSRDGASAAKTDKSAGFVSHAFFLKVSLEHHHRHVVGLLIDVQELRNGAGLRDRFRRSDKRVWNGEYYIACLYPAGYDGKPQCVSAAIDGDGVTRFAKLRKCRLEVFHHRTTDESG